jgi:predicted GTPase
LQSIILKLAVGKTTVNFKLTDTCGLTTQIHHEEIIRRGMVQTLTILREADFIMHIVDVSDIQNHQINPDNIDTEIFNYGKVRHNYVMLANKMDLPSAKENYKKVVSLFLGVPVIPISGLYGNGFREVRACVARNI